MISSYYQGYLYKKTFNWTEYFILWGSTWKRKFLILTDLGLLIFDENNLKKPSKFVSTFLLEIDDMIDQNEFRREYVFKLFDNDTNEIILAAENA
jgi:hypothetical protein